MHSKVKLSDKIYCEWYNIILYLINGFHRQLAGNIIPNWIQDGLVQVLKYSQYKSAILLAHFKIKKHQRVKIEMRYIVEKGKMKLYICGNGFDLHHGLRTSYKDYRDYLLKNHPQAALDYADFPFLNPDVGDNWSDIEKSFHIDYLSMLSKFSDLE